MTAFNCVRASCTAAASAAALRVCGQLRPPGSPARLNGNGKSIAAPIPPGHDSDSGPVRTLASGCDLCSSKEPSSKEPTRPA